MRFPLQRSFPVPTPPHHGAFGAERRYDVHTGVDLYVVLSGKDVLAIEAGAVVGVGPFTGLRAGSPWWLDTDAVLVEGASGVFLYGEVATGLAVGDAVAEGQRIATVQRVLRHDKGLPISMLHMELYAPGYRGAGETWALGAPQPDPLRDPTAILQRLHAEHFHYKSGPGSAGDLSMRMVQKEVRKQEEIAAADREAILRPDFVCPTCGDAPELVDGRVVYPHRPDLFDLWFWRCPGGHALVGCHAGTRVPKGSLATLAVRRARMQAHAAFDPLWQSGRMSRTRAYKGLAQRLGIPVQDCHIGHFGEEMCARVLAACKDFEEGDP